MIYRRPIRDNRDNDNDHAHQCRRTRLGQLGDISVETQRPRNSQYEKDNDGLPICEQPQERHVAQAGEQRLNDMRYGVSHYDAERQHPTEGKGPLCHRNCDQPCSAETMLHCRLERVCAAKLAVDDYELNRPVDHDRETDE